MRHPHARRIIQAGLPTLNGIVEGLTGLDGTGVVCSDGRWARQCWIGRV